MAKINPASTTKPVQGAATAPAATAPAATAPAANGNGGDAKMPKIQKPKQQMVFSDAETAIKEAQGREKGARRAFKFTDSAGAETFITAFNYDQASRVYCETAKVKCEEIGVAAKAPKAVSPESVMSMVASLPEDQKEAVLKALAAMVKQ